VPDAPDDETTLATKLRLYQGVLGYTDEALDAAAGAGAMARLRSHSLSPDDLATLGGVAKTMGVGPGDLLPDALDPSDLEPVFAGMPRKQIQELHEMAVARSLAKVMRAKGLQIHELRRGDPAAQEPDAVFSFSSAGVRASAGIEITCVGYFTRGTAEANDYARDLWNFAARAGASENEETDSGDGEAEDATFEYSPVLVNFDDVRAYVQSLIEQKCGKTYALPTILVIDAGMHHLHLTPAEEGLAVMRALQVPEHCPFARIYLRMTWNVSGEIEYFTVS
jgi:hypothetical protein